MFTKVIEPLATLAGRKVTVMGLGLFGGGQGVTEFLCRRGARVTVTDLRSEEVLRPTLAELAHLPVEWVLGKHREEDFLSADLVIASPAVPRTAPLLQRCVAKGIPLETEMNLFFKHCRGRICGVTGSNGKTTTTHLVGAMAAQQWPGVKLGGNLGRSLLPELDAIAADDWVVLELSSFQLEDLAGLDRRPEVAVVTNLSPNHLDRHATYGDYAAAKKEILRPAAGPSTAVLNGEDPRVRSWAPGGSGIRFRRTIYFGRTARVVPAADGAWISEDGTEVFLGQRGRREHLFAAADLALPGRFNLLNAAAAAAAAWSMGVEPAKIADAVRAFCAVEHRLEPAAACDGVQYLNDSIATTPESTIAALEALGPNVIVICGGSRKGCSFRALGKVIHRRARGVVLLGQTAAEIRASIPSLPGGPEIRAADSLEEAVVQARALARSGDRVILSPACPSYDMFVNFVERGRKFKEIARSLTPSKGAGAVSPGAS